MIGVIETRKILILDEEAYDIFKNFDRVIANIFTEDDDVNLAIGELQESYANFWNTFDEIKKKEE